MNLMDKLNQNSNLSNYNNSEIENKIEKININNLKVIENQFFKKYNGERYSILKDSIKNVGIITPLIVRKTTEDKYIILSGRHRYYIANELGITEIPCIIKYNISDDDANLILIDSNLAQRDKLYPSEIAKSLKAKCEIMNRRGSRSDLFNSNNKGKTTAKIIGEEFNISKTMVFNYIRLCDLIDDLLDLIDNEKIGLSVGFILSNLTKENQEILKEYLETHKVKISITNAKNIKEIKKLDNDILNKIFNSKEMKSNNKKITNALSVLKLNNYFEKETTNEEIINTIKKALDLYLNSKN